MNFMIVFLKKVSTHSRPKAAGTNSVAVKSPPIVSTHSRPKAAGFASDDIFMFWRVSTHSRPKAAGRLNNSGIDISSRFNSQPPEGGWTM